MSSLITIKASCDIPVDVLFSFFFALDYKTRIFGVILHEVLWGRTNTFLWKMQMHPILTQIVLYK